MNNANITIPVDLTNPGQFFACCGLLELADRLWPGTEGWFCDGSFKLTCDGSFGELIDTVVNAEIGSSLSSSEVKRLGTLLSAKKSTLTKDVVDEKAYLQAKWKVESIYVKSPAFLLIDWWRDVHGERQDPKTWAAKQFVTEIIGDIRNALVRLEIKAPVDLWRWVPRTGRRFYFDSDLGAEGTPRDVGFSFDPLNENKRTFIHFSCRPAIELLAFIGLQRCRPTKIDRNNRFLYRPWTFPIAPSVAGAIGAAMIDAPGTVYEFYLFDRTEYFKSFLPAQPFQGDRYE